MHSEGVDPGWCWSDLSWLVDLCASAEKSVPVHLTDEDSARGPSDTS